ncbi:MAG: exodeoxyribonuclease VII small subunit [Erysipelotrichaceae bacterium]|nr:exodeoxyribonuclease VII small subunit [Erysipelotrichaceae bacterium]
MEDNKYDFEASLTKLEEIVSKISDQSLGLDESLKLYEEGTKIVKELELALKKASEEVEKVIEVK